MNTGILVSVEGISGCGKTYLLKDIKDKIKYKKIFFVKEASDRLNGGVDKKILNIIKAKNNDFFQNGIPNTETLLLLALKAYDYESIIQKKIKQGYIVFEDRSIDTVAVYQSIILKNGANETALKLALEIFTFASMWRKPPDLMFLITDTFNNSIARAEKRNRKKYDKSEIKLLKNADIMYKLYSETKSMRKRITVLDKSKIEYNNFINIIQNKIDQCLIKK